MANNKKRKAPNPLTNQPKKGKAPSIPLDKQFTRTNSKRKSVVFKNLPSEVQANLDLAIAKATK